MPSPSDLESVRVVVARLNDRLIHALDSAEIEACLSELTSSATALSNLQPSRGLRAELEALRAELSQAAGLAASGLDLQLGWARALGGMLGGYTSAGDPAPLLTQTQISVEG